MKTHFQIFLLLLLVFPQLSNAASSDTEAYNKSRLIITNPAITTEGSVWKNAATTLQNLNTPTKQEVLSSITDVPLPAAIWLFAPAIIGLFSLKKKS